MRTFSQNIHLNIESQRSGNTRRVEAMRHDPQEEGFEFPEGICGHQLCSGFEILPIPVVPFLLPPPPPPLLPFVPLGPLLPPARPPLPPPPPPLSANENLSATTGSGYTLVGIAFSTLSGVPIPPADCFRMDRRFCKSDQYPAGKEMQQGLRIG